MDVSLDAFKIFYEVAREGNITKAAEKLFISQPAVTQTIKKLEDQLNVTLFIRNKKGVALTRLGEEIFAKVENAMVSMEKVEKIIEEENDLLTGEVIVSCGGTIARRVLVPAIEEFVSAFPQVNVTHCDNIQTKAVAQLKQGKIDLLITQQNDQIEDFKFEGLCEEKYVLIKSTKLEYENNDLRFIMTNDGAYSQKLFKQFIADNNLEDVPLVKVNGFNMIVELCRVGVGVGIVPYYLAKGLIDSNEIKAVYEEYKLPSVQYGCYYNEANLTRGAREFLKILLASQR